jgi:hypothetical protein
LDITCIFNFYRITLCNQNAIKRLTEKETLLTFFF